MLQQNKKITYTAQHYSNAETVGVVQDTTVFVPYMIVGEVATVRVDYVKRSVAFGTVEKVLKCSTKRVKPPCKHFGKCGGCALMHMSYDEQLVFKTTKVGNNLAKIGKLNCEVLPCVASPKVLGYRNKLSLPVCGSKGKVRIGMYQRNSHYVVDMDNCMLGADWSNAVVRVCRQFFNDSNLVPYNQKDFSGQIRHIVARYVDSQLLLTVVTNGIFNINWQPLIKGLTKHFGNSFGLFVNINTLHNNVILGAKTQHVYGLTHISSNHFGVQFKLAPNSFFQVNDGVKDGIYAKAKELLNTSNTQVLVDCFSGIGILSNALASPNYDTYAIEIEPSAVEDAEQIRLLNNTPRLTNILGDVNVELPKLTQQNKGKNISLVVDPPRKGLGETICNTIINAKVDNIVYISCDSATLARDLAQLSSHSQITYVEPWDMFPNTDQVETIVCLTKR